MRVTSLMFQSPNKIKFEWVDTFLLISGNLNALEKVNVKILN